MSQKSSAASRERCESSAPTFRRVPLRGDNGEGRLDGSVAIDRPTGHDEEGGDSRRRAEGIREAASLVRWNASGVGRSAGGGDLA
jgi:hypothetical protein